MNHYEVKVWDHFLDCFESLPQSSPIPRMLIGYIKNNLLKGKLHIRLTESHVVCNEQNLDVTKRKKIRKIFEIFIEQDCEPVSKNLLIKNVYSDNYENQSYRLQMSHKQNVVKLISRARRLAECSFEANDPESQLEWFPYDSSSQTWKLYNLKEDNSF